MVGEGWRSKFLRNWMLPLLAPLLSHFDTFRKSLFQTLSQTRIKYRDSSISEGQVGELHGGDRMPWTGDNFGHPWTLSWHLQIFGDANPDFEREAGRLGLPFLKLPISSLGKSNGVKERAAYLIRPDSHIALAIEHQDSSVLLAFLQRNGLTLV
jgi:hypothetical protein